MRTDGDGRRDAEAARGLRSRLAQQGGFEMAKKKTGITRFRNGSAKNQVLKMAASTVLGGASGAMVGGLLVRAGVKPTTAAVGVTVAGAVGASTLKGMGRLAAGGAAAAGAGQLALAWLSSQSQPKKPGVPAPVPAKTGRNAGPEDIESAFARAREQLELEDEAAAYVDGYDIVELDEEVHAAA
jgi:hypothetical protein